MKINRTSIGAGLAVGVLAGGAGGAIAATSSGSTTASTSPRTMSRVAGGWDGYGYGLRGGATWRGLATGVGWGAWGNDTNVGGMRWTSSVRSVRRAAVTYLALSASQLRSRLQSGETLAEIASSRGKSEAGLERAMEAAATDGINADGALTASQKSSILANLAAHVDSVVTGAWHAGPAGLMSSSDW